MKFALYLHSENKTSMFYFIGTLAQLVEQWTENPCVPGSIPGGTTQKTTIKSWFFCFKNLILCCSKSLDRNNSILFFISFRYIIVIV